MKKNLIIIAIILIVILSILFTLFLFNKNNVYNAYLLNSGSVSQEEFSTKMPYERINGLNFISVTIQNKKYKFLIDTGAISIVSKSIANEIGLESLAYSNTTDSQGVTKKVDLALLPEITIGEIKFEDYGVAIMNLEDQLSCLDIDGIIGSNLISDAIWEVDESNQILTVTNSIKNLKLQGYNQEIYFTTDKQKTPFTKLLLNNKFSSEVIIDTGYDGSILLTSDFDKITKGNTSLIEVIGNSTYGIHKKEMDSTSNFFIRLESIKTNNVVKERPIVHFMKNGNLSKIGNSFFYGYNYIIDYGNKRILMKKNNKDIKTDNYRSYGFDWNYLNGNVFITQLIKSSNAINDLKIGDQILEINGENWTKLNKRDWCRISSQKLPTNISVKIKRTNEIKTINVAIKEYLN